MTEITFEKHYLSSLYPETVNQDRLVQSGEIKANILLFLEKTFYEVEEAKEFVSLKTAAEQVLRWCTPELHKSMQDLGFTNAQIAHIHGIIIGEDGNVLGHSLNIFELGQIAEFL